MYAIVDIETTGSFPASNGITEIAIVLHNGIEVEGSYTTLINPGVPIPQFVSQLTGIYNYTVADAPPFTQVADKIYNLLRNRIFVAHNVNFDYTFLRHHLEAVGYNLAVKKICTLRMARQAFPGHKKYGLESITQVLQIPHQNKHRAGGDAMATAILFQKCFEVGGEALVKEMLKKGNQEYILPPNLDKSYVKQLPQQPGVYYFHNAQGKIIYVGKAKQIKQRVVSHFTGHDIGKKRQQFLREIHAVSYTTTPTELTALLLESVEIRKHWPAYNVSQKVRASNYGICLYTDSAGYLRLVIDKLQKTQPSLYRTAYLVDAHRLLWRLVHHFELDPYLCCLSKVPSALLEPHELYNEKVLAAVASLQAQQPTYLLQEATEEGTSCVLVEKGSFYGFGLLPNNFKWRTVSDIKRKIKQYPVNEHINAMIRSFEERYAGKMTYL